MPATDRDPMQPRLWLASLGTLCAGSMAADEARSRVAALDAALTGEFDQRAFCMASVRHVARAAKYFPTYGEICASLSEWWRDFRPPSSLPQLSAPSRLPPAEQALKDEADDRAWWQERIASWSDRSPDERWFRAMSVITQVSQPNSPPRPWIVPMINAVLRFAEEDGADTTQTIPPPVPYPERKDRMVPKIWQSRRQQPQQAAE